MKKLLIPIAFACLPTHAEDIHASWSAVTTAEDGSYLPRDIIEYHLYVMKSDDTLYRGIRLAGTSWVVKDVPLGCYTLYVRAIRTDEGLYSEMSNSEQKCIEGVDEPVFIRVPKPPKPVKIKKKKRL